MASSIGGESVTSSGESRTTYLNESRKQQQQQQQLSPSDQKNEKQRSSMKAPVFDCKLINVNITSSSPPNEESGGEELTKMTITRTNSAKHSNSGNGGGWSENGGIGGGGGCNKGTCLRNQESASRKASTITFQTPSPTSIKRPNSTIGLPTSIIANNITSNSSSNNNNRNNSACNSNNSNQSICGGYIERPTSNSDFNRSIRNRNSYNLSPTEVVTAMMAASQAHENDILGSGFNPVIREKAASLTLPDQKQYFLRKGCSNPFLIAANCGVSPGQCNLSTYMPQHRTSIVLNEHTVLQPMVQTSPIFARPDRPPMPGSNSSRHLPIHLQENAIPVSGIYTDGSGVSSFKPRGSMASNMTNTHRSSYIGDEEHYHLHQHYLATSGRKDTIISLGKNLQIQFNRPSTRCCSWSARTFLEKFLLIILLIITIVISTYFIIPPKFDEGGPKICTTLECVKTASSLLNAMDLTADPCVDFYTFSCGAWVKKHTLPADRSSLGTFEVMADNMQIILKDLLEQPPNAEDNSATLKAKSFYQSCMNIQQIEKIGNATVLHTLQVVGNWPVLDATWDAKRVHELERSILAADVLEHDKSSSSSATLRAEQQRQSKRVPFTIENLLGKIRGDFNLPIIVEQYVGPDDRDSLHNIIQFDQSTLGLPSREYYWKNNETIGYKARDAYLELMIDIAELLGAKREYATEQMTKVLDFEIELANASMPEADRHDTSAIYNKTTIQELKDLVPEFDWMAYLQSFMPVIVKPTDKVVVYSIDYFKKMGKIIAQTMRDDQRVVVNYAVWRLIKNMLPLLDGPFGEKRAKFRKVLSGISADRDRWIQCVDLVNKKMGMAVGSLFIRDNFDPKSKEVATEMIHNIRQAFNELLLYNDWMDDETRAVAKEKANAINERIGYPDLLTNPIELSKEYNYLEVHENHFLENIINVSRYEAHKNLIKLGTPVNKDSWTTDPAVVNAFYSPNRNDIVFPAGILQPLFYSHHFPKSLNYGGIGVVIGHEITHGFDDRGRQFDKYGNMKQWWNDVTIERFRVRAQCIIDQYSSYVLQEINEHVNGRMTQGENIADNGGLKQAYRAFKKWENQNGVEPLLPGMNLTHDQLFFLNYAQIWCGSMRPQEASQKIRSAVHSPGPIRVLGPLSNSYDFAKAYKCPVGSRMNPIKKCSVW